MKVFTTHQVFVVIIVKIPCNIDSKLEMGMNWVHIFNYYGTLGYT